MPERPPCRPSAPSRPSPAERLVDAFATFGPAYGRLMARGRGRGGTQADAATWQQLRALELLRRGGPMSMVQLAGGLGVTARNVTSLVDRLESGRLVQRGPHPADRRVTLLELTDRGRRLNERLFAGYRGRAVRLFEQLDAADQETLERLIRQLTDALAAGPAEDGEADPALEAP